MAVKAAMLLACCCGHASTAADGFHYKPWDARSRHLNTKSPYTAPASVNLDEGSACVATAAYGVFRHGSRYPQAKDVGKLLALRARLRLAASLPPELGWLRGWDPRSLFPASEDGTLHEVGKAELRQIAQRLQAAYPVVFPADTLSPQQLDFGATAKLRTQQSAQAFAAGLQGTTAEHTIDTLHHAPIDGDRLLRFFKACPRYRDTVKDNETLLELEAGDVDLLRRAVGAELQPRLAAARITVGADDDASAAIVDVSAVKAIWKSCQYETLLQLPQNRSNWCAVLSAEDVLMLEAASDVEDYWSKGPGQAISSTIACELLQHAVERLSAAVRAGGAVAGAVNSTTLQFAHAETVVPLLGLLGVGTEQPALRMPHHGATASAHADGLRDAAQQLAGTMEDATMKDARAAIAPDALGGREWRLSELSPMASNVLLLLRDCGTSNRNAANGNSGLMLTVLHNEMPLRLQRCGGRFHCPWEEFLDAFAAELNACSLDTLCEERVDNIEGVGSTSFWGVVLLELVIFSALMAFAVAVKLVPAPKLSTD